uniref:Uncharacterized protein n=1 Tax=Vespula pensylvanica TaxID=30213 RepID=A0A834UCM4_VESPE|nr:hypothetical protein H0235_006492 [Vespula pensylvanica]
MLALSQLRVRATEHYSSPAGKPTAVKVQFVTSVARAVARVVARIVARAVARAVTRDCLAHRRPAESDRGPIAGGGVEGRDSRSFFNGIMKYRTARWSQTACPSRVPVSSNASNHAKTANTQMRPRSGTSS